MLTIGKKMAAMGFALTAGLLPLSDTVCWAGELTTSDEILNALVPKITGTRSLSAQHPDTAQRQAQLSFPDSLRSRAASSLSPDERQRLLALAEDKPNIDVSVNFEYNSDRIGAAATPATQEIGKALLNPKLAGGVFMVAGHTDGKGNDEYNQGLSERRAEVVKAYLVANYHIPAANLVAVGFGKSRLKNTSNPFASENRRVQIVNMTPAAVARE